MVSSQSRLLVLFAHTWKQVTHKIAKATTSLHVFVIALKCKSIQNSLAEFLEEPGWPVLYLLSSWPSNSPLHSSLDSSYTTLLSVFQIYQGLFLLPPILQVVPLPIFFLHHCSLLALCPSGPSLYVTFSRRIYLLIIKEVNIYLIHEARSQQNVSVKSWRVNMFGFTGHTISVATIQLCCYR
jgi:hypothetical protein